VPSVWILGRLGNAIVHGLYGSRGAITSSAAVVVATYPLFVSVSGSNIGFAERNVRVRAK
jgi:hypothetical protein